MSKQSVKFAYFGHHKCMTTTLQTVMLRFCDALGLCHKALHDASQFNNDLPGYVRSNGIECLSLTNADAAYVDQLEPDRAIHVVRDPRDLLVSAYFSHLHSHPTHQWPELAAFREKLRQADKARGLMLELDYLGDFVFRRMTRWNYENPAILEMRMEEFLRDMPGACLRIAEHFGVLAQKPSLSAEVIGRLAASVNRGWRVTKGRSILRIPRQSISADSVRRIAAEFEFARLAGQRQPGKEDVRSHFRKGKAGDWVNHFTPEVVEIFKRRHQGLLEKLGYEASGDWTLPKKKDPAEAGSLES